MTIEVSVNAEDGHF